MERGGGTAERKARVRLDRSRKQPIPHHSTSRRSRRLPGSPFLPLYAARAARAPSVEIRAVIQQELYTQKHTYLRRRKQQTPVTVPFADSTRVPFRQDSVQGGSGVLTSQSQCPFKAFATARLGAKDWEPAEVGLSAIQRGQILHAVLHSIWAWPSQRGSDHTMI